MPYRPIFSIKNLMRLFFSKSHQGLEAGRGEIIDHLKKNFVDHYIKSLCNKITIQI